MKAAFNVRVYGILEHRGRILLLDERYKEHRFTKFQGGGLEFGEGLVDCVIREFREELNLKVEQCLHFYTTANYQPSFFRTEDQIISIYYKVEVESLGLLKLQNDPNERIIAEAFRWEDPLEFSEDRLKFPIDQKVWRMLRSQS